MLVQIEVEEVQHTMSTHQNIGEARLRFCLNYLLTSLDAIASSASLYLIVVSRKRSRAVGPQGPELNSGGEGAEFKDLCLLKNRTILRLTRCNLESSYLRGSDGQRF